MSCFALDIITAIGSMGSLFALMFAIYAHRPKVVPILEYYLHMCGKDNDYTKSYFFLSVKNVGNTSARQIEMKWRIRNNNNDYETTMDHPYSENHEEKFDYLTPGECRCRVHIDSLINNYLLDGTVDLYLDVTIKHQWSITRKNTFKLNIDQKVKDGYFVNYSNRISEPPQNFKYLLNEERKV